MKFYAACFFAVLPLIRTDFYIYTVLLSFVGDYRLAHRMSIILFGFLSYLSAVFGVSGYGYLKTLKFTLAGPFPYPNDIIWSYGIHEFLEWYKNLLLELILRLEFYVILIATSLFFAMRYYKKMRPEDRVLIILIGFVFSHLVLFPAYMQRFFVMPVMYAVIYISWNKDLLSFRKAAIH